MSLLLIIACVFLFLAAFGLHWARCPRLHFGWLGVALWCLPISLPVGRLGYFHFVLEWVIVVALVIVIIMLLVRPKQTL
jgi:hypothetical protein